jgi:tRNA(Ile)-lysidine synthetase-like protein
MTFLATMQSDITPTFSSSKQWIPLAGITGSLQVRCANPDETMIPFGEDEERPLLDILQDAGIPSHERRVRQGIADAAGMLWYPGVRAAERCRVGNEDALIALDYQGAS